ncbi:MAG: MDR family MFS transporter [Candidatus Methanomethylophilaceae archaeon]|jgi:EmrB/QacA subfamily drug resistance transporter
MFHECLEDVKTKEAQTNWSNIDKKTRSMIMIGLGLGLLIASLDSTIVGTSMKTIVEDIGGMDQISWVVTAYLLCETIMIPIGGKLSDRYGRRPIFLAGISFFIGGSILCGFSTNVYMLIAFRAIQGLGGGILVPVATSAVADLYPPEQRGKMQAILGSVFAFASCIGPFIGGFVVDNLPWEWVFFINVPFGIIALILTAKEFPAILTDTSHKIDYLGMAVLSLGIVVLLLLLQWGNEMFPWASIETMLMATAFFIIMGVFMVVERRSEDPIIAPRMFRNRTFLCSALALGVMGLGMMGVMMYLSLFMQEVMNATATMSGIIMIPLIIGMIITSMSSGILVNRTGYKIWIIIGPIIACTGMALMSTMSTNTPMNIVSIYLLITGLGLGCLMSVPTVAVQNNVRKKDLGMATSGVILFRNIGEAIASGIVTSVINMKLYIELKSSLPANIFADLPSYKISLIESFRQYSEFDDYTTEIITSFSNSVTFSYLICGILMFIALIAGVAIKNGHPMSNEDYDKFSAEQDALIDK